MSGVLNAHGIYEPPRLPLLQICLHRKRMLTLHLVSVQRSLEDHTSHCGFDRVFVDVLSINRGNYDVMSDDRPSRNETTARNI